MAKYSRDPYNRPTNITITIPAASSKCLYTRNDYYNTYTRTWAVRAKKKTFTTRRKEGYSFPFAIYRHLSSRHAALDDSQSAAVVTHRALRFSARIACACASFASSSSRQHAHPHTYTYIRTRTRQYHNHGRACSSSRGRCRKCCTKRTYTHTHPRV